MYGCMHVPFTARFTEGRAVHVLQPRHLLLGGVLDLLGGERGRVGGGRARARGLKLHHGRERVGASGGGGAALGGACESALHERRE